VNIESPVQIEAAECFAIALFAGIERPAVAQKTVSLDELRQMLSRFEVLADKRRGRCWSPTRYTADASSRGNAGVLEVSALVFDCDRVAPDPEHLAGGYWLGHTTWSHTPTAPHWGWSFRLRLQCQCQCQPRAGATSGSVHAQRCAPEADPACKARAGRTGSPATAAASRPKRPATTGRSWIRQSCPLRRSTDSDRRRGEAYMDSVIASLEAAAPGGQC
jgi:hypothetical protein